MYLGHKEGFYSSRVLYLCRGEFQSRGRSPRVWNSPRQRSTKSKSYKTFLARGAYIALSAGEFITSVLHELELVLLN